MPGDPSLPQVIKPLRSIQVGSDFVDGVNFYDDFDAEVVGLALWTLHTFVEARGIPCYCAQLAVDHDNKGYFHRFGPVLPPADHPQSPRLSPEVRIPLRDLLQDDFSWPLLAIRESPPPSAVVSQNHADESQEFLSRISWYAYMRLQAGNTYVGYFVLAGLDGCPAPSDKTLRRVACLVKVEVERVLAFRRVARARTSPDFKTRLRYTLAAINELRSYDCRGALKRVADMLTSHLGVGWNRAACYWPVNSNTLRCLWAQGGDGSEAWCWNVQRPIGEGIREVSDLVAMAQLATNSGNDRYLAAAAGRNPIQIDAVQDHSNDNILARLWRSNGDVRALPIESQYWEIGILPNPSISIVDREVLSLGGPVGAVFNEQDPWVRQTVRERPGDPIFVSRNGRYFLLPWCSRNNLIAVWLLDMAYWGDLASPQVPSLAFTAEILASLGPPIDRFRRDCRDTR